MIDAFAPTRRRCQSENPHWVTAIVHRRIKRGRNEQLCELQKARKFSSGAVEKNRGTAMCRASAVGEDERCLGEL